jgi:6-pyruvoyltetrahydropterin/6-carboxytetrahydropterin synthase
LSLIVERLLFTAAVPFEAARHIDALPQGHRARRLHGHSFLVKARAELPHQWAAFAGDEVDRLRTKLADTVSVLDYQTLNDIVDQPTDENLARWIRAQLAVPGIHAIALHSTARQGVDLDPDGHAHVWRRYSLECAHRLPNVSVGHKCGRMHGHGFAILVHAQQHIGAQPIGTNYDLIDALWAPIDVQLNHACLNDITGLLNPTSELLAAWIWNRLKPVLPELSSITVYETAQSGASYDGNRHRIWKEMTLDSSTALTRAPVGDQRRRIHGHTYTLRLHLHAPLDTVMGWIVDFGDVKELFDPVFKRVDHQALHELAGLGTADCAGIARWIRHEIAADLPAVDRIDLFETRGCGVILSRGGADLALPI